MHGCIPVKCIGNTNGYIFIALTGDRHFAFSSTNINIFYITPTPCRSIYPYLSRQSHTEYLFFVVFSIYVDIVSIFHVRSCESSNLVAFFRSNNHRVACGGSSLTDRYVLNARKIDGILRCDSSLNYHIGIRYFKRVRTGSIVLGRSQLSQCSHLYRNRTDVIVSGRTFLHIERVSIHVRYMDGVGCIGEVTG